MIQAYKYFMIPFTSVPKTPPYTVWFADSSQPDASWSGWSLRSTWTLQSTCTLRP